MPSLVIACQEGNQHTIMLSSSFAADLRPFKRPLFSVIDISEGVVTLELAWETLLEGAILPEAGGIHPRPRAKRNVILMVQRASPKSLGWLKLLWTCKWFVDKVCGVIKVDKVAWREQWDKCVQV